MTIIARALAVAFPATGTHAEALAAARDADADREALKSIIRTTRTPKGSTSMSNVATIPHLPAADDADREIRKLMATANAAAESTGETFRKAMQQITEAQSREIDRLRKIVADISKDRPRKIVSLTACKMRSDSGHEADAIVGVANDGTIWSADKWLTAWERCADLPQPSEELDR